jgi:hypothetical protein
MDFQNIIIAVRSLLFGFILKIIHAKIFEKRVSLHHQLENPAVFRLPKQVSFQNLRVWNTGKLPANEVKVNLDKKIIDESQAEYKSNTEDPYTQEAKEDILTFKFAKLRPKEELIISFLSEKPLDANFLLSVKSDEMVSFGAAKELRLSIGIIVGFIFMAGLAIFGFLNFLDTIFGTKRAFSPSPYSAEKAPIALSPIALSINTTPIRQIKGKKMDISFLVENRGNEILADVLLYFEIPGVWQEIEFRRFLNKGEQVSYKKTILIPQDIPSGGHRIVVKAFVELSKGRFFKSEAEAQFSVQ